MTDAELEELAHRLLTEERLARFQAVAASRLACLTVVFENITDPFNVAASLRSAESFGLPHAHVVTQDMRPINQTMSAAANRWITVTRHRQLAPLVEQLRADGYTLLGSVPPREAMPFAELELPAKVALFMGGEKEGLSPDAIAACDQLITIPMVGFTESLNLSTATAILLQHYASRYRQRGASVLLSAEQQRALILQWCERDLSEKMRGKLPAR